MTGRMRRFLFAGGDILFTFASHSFALGWSMVFKMERASSYRLALMCSRACNIRSLGIASAC